MSAAHKAYKGAHTYRHTCICDREMPVDIHNWLCITVERVGCGKANEFLILFPHFPLFAGRILVLNKMFGSE